MHVVQYFSKSVIFIIIYASGNWDIKQV